MTVLTPMQQIAVDVWRKHFKNMTPETTPTPKFAIGDVVQLKSGGPLMTVQQIGPSPIIGCTWFYDQVNSEERDFFEDCLSKV